MKREVLRAPGGAHEVWPPLGDALFGGD